jgi:hypothetical protein
MISTRNPLYHVRSTNPPGNNTARSASGRESPERAIKGRLCARSCSRRKSSTTTLVHYRLLSTDSSTLKDAPPIPPTTPAGRRQDSLLESAFGAPSQRPLNRLPHSAREGGVRQRRRTRSSDQGNTRPKAGVCKGVCV